MQRALLILLFAASYLLLAGSEPWALGALLGVAALGALAAPAATFAFRRSTRPLDIALIALIAALIVQLIPMPHRFTAMLSPHEDAVRSAVRFAPFGASRPAWSPLSVNPSATVLALETVVLAVLSFWVARAVFSAGGGTRLFCRWVAFLGALAAAMATIQKSVAPRTVLFVAVPDARSASPFGAFVNRNHFAAWLLMASAPVIGYCIARINTHPSPRGRWRQSVGQIMRSGALFTAIAATGMIGVLLLTLSRSALAALGSAALIGWWLGRARLRIERTTIPGALAVIGVALMMIVLFVDVDGWATRAEQTFDAGGGTFSRITIWQESMRVVRDFWLTGTGAGTFSDSMTVYQQTRIWVGAMQKWAQFNNAHSFYLQVASEGGLLVAIPALATLLTTATLGWKAARADKGEMFWVRVGAFAGLAGVAVQSVWEVPLVMPANAALAGMVAGLLLYQREVTAGRAGQVMPTPPAVTPVSAVRIAR